MTTQKGCIFIGQTLQMPNGYIHGQSILRFVQSVGNLLVPTLAADAGHQSDISLNARQTVYLVIGRLTQQHNTTQRLTQIAITRRLTTPWRTVNGGMTIVKDPYNGVVVVQQFRTFDMFQPQAGVCAFASTTNT